MEAAIITDPAWFSIGSIFHFTPFILPCCYPVNFITTHPELYLAGTGRAIAVCVHRLREPYTVLKAEGFIGEGANWTNINHVTDEFVVEGLLYISCDLRMISPVEDTMFAFVGELVRCIYATIAKDTTRHVQLDIITQVVRSKCAAFEFVTGTLFAMLIAEILQVAFTCLVADGAVERVVDQ